MTEKTAKDFNAMLHNSKDMPKIQTITDPKSIAKYGGSRMYLAPPLDYDRVMRQIPSGRVMTTAGIRAYLARVGGADFTDPLTAGLFVVIAAWASEQRSGDRTPYWRVLKADGELNPRFPGGVAAQKELLEAEGHEIVVKGRGTVRCFVRQYEEALFVPADRTEETAPDVRAD